MFSAGSQDPHAAAAASPAAAAAVNGLLDMAAARADKLAEWRHVLHQMPELGLDTPRTSAFISERLAEAGIVHETGAAGEVVALIGSRNAGARCVLLRADMDALPFPERSGEPWASKEGRAHACGHDMHATSLLGAAMLLKAREQELVQAEVVVKLLFQPGEETFEGARAAIADGVLEDPAPEAAFALHVNGRCPMGLMIYGSDEFAGVWGFRIRLLGRGGHGSAPEKCADPITAAVHVHLALEEIMALEVRAGTEAVLSVGKFWGGAAGNAIPDECVLEGTLRAHDEEVLRSLRDRVAEAASAVARVYRVEPRVETLSDMPPVHADEAFTNACIGYVGAAAPGIRFRNIQHSLGAEDFALISEMLPSAYFTVGAAAEDAQERFSMHDPRVRFDDDALPVCAAAYASVALGWAADCVGAQLPRP